MALERKQLSEIDHPPLVCVLVNKLRSVLKTVRLDDHTDKERPLGPINGDIYLMLNSNMPPGDERGCYVVNQTITANNGFRQHFYSGQFLEEQADLVMVDGVWTLIIGNPESVT
jgi:hypothetical protein